MSSINLKRDNVAHSFKYNYRVDKIVNDYEQENTVR